MFSSQKTRVGVLRGGPSAEYLVSLETGKRVLESLPEEYYTPVDIFISKNGEWHEDGLSKTPENILKKVDVVWNGLHGKYGEDGEVAKVLEQFSVPYTGSSSLSSALAMNKLLAKKVYKNHGLKTPFSMSLPFESLSRKTIAEVFLGMPGPYVVKPASSGSSLGVRVAFSKPELEESVVAAFEYSPQVLIEEYIKGKEVFVGIINDYRNQSLYSMLPVSDYSLNQVDRDTASDFAMKAHVALGLSSYSSSDLIIHPTRGIFILETDVLPPLHSKSKFSQSLENIGAKLSGFLHQVVQNVLHPTAG